MSVVGNGGCSTITFEGNGFNNLYAVDLYNAQGDTIKHVYIGHESDATTSVVFDFSDAKLGQYNAQFRFTTEDKNFNNLVTVEEAHDIELATTVTYPATFLRGTSTTYTIKITNKGNMTAYAVPVEVRLRIASKQDLTEIKFSDNLDNFSIPLELRTDSLDEDVLSALNEELINYSDLAQFVFFTDSLTNTDYGLSQLFLIIRPNTTETFSITIRSASIVSLETTVTKEWIPLTTKDLANKTKAIHIKRKSKEWMCCNRQKVECVADVVANIAGSFMPPGANCATSLSVTGLEAIYDYWCSEGNTASEKFENYLNNEGKSLARKLLNTAISCVTGYFDKYIKGLKKDRTEAMKYNDIPRIKQLNHDIFSAEKSLKYILSNLGKGIVYGFVGNDCILSLAIPVPNCPPNPDGGGGTSKPVKSMDPNEIYGYLAESGSNAVNAGRTDVYYRIEFENDTTFATAPAHDVWVTDTFDATKFDLSTFAPTRIKIGDKEAMLKGDKNFVTTIDMRPEINAIAQVEGTFDEQKGIAKWHISSLDPMTMEPADEVMQGILPVNYDGYGIGEVSYDISLKPNLAHGTEVKNRAGIVFDTNETIMTPYWTNIIDRIAPESHVTDVQMATDSTATVRIEAIDELSGSWRYDVYVQYGSGAWFKAAENVPADTTATVKVYEGIDHGFYVVATDSAGNVEQKEAAREYTFEVFGPQIDTDTRIELAEGWNWISHNQQEPLAVEALKPAGSRMLGQTEELIDDSRFGWMGDLEELLPTQMYKLQMDGPLTVQLSGRLFNAGFRSIPLYEGWNWLGYPVAVTMSPGEALAKLEAEEGEVLIGQDGMAVYNEGQWAGTLLEMVPGQGYMFRSQSDKNLFYNATAQASSRRVYSPRSVAHSLEAPEGWTADKRKYPNVMGVIATLWHEDTMADNDGWLLAAFCGEECRGVAKAVDGVLMMNVYGQGGEPIMFRAMNYETGEVLDAAEQEQFRTAVVGTMVQPYQLHIGEATGVRTVTSRTQPTGRAVYDLQGRQLSDGRLSDGQMKKGVYVVTGDGKGKTQKVIRK